MRWANFLHMYQPTEQQSDILEAIVAQSYRPVVEGLINHKRICLTLNVNGALLELLDKYGYHDIIDNLRNLGREKRIEFTSSTKYHALAPFLNEQEIVRQITLNNESLEFFLGKKVKPKGFFPPEMAYDEKIIPIIEDMGFKWLILDEISCGGEVGRVDYGKIYKVKDSKLSVFFRQRRLSNLIMSAVVRSRKTLLEAMHENLESGKYIVTAMDLETFGHHRPGLEKLLFEVLDTPEIDLIQISDAEKYYKEEKEVIPTKATWASSKQDIDKGIQFLSWSDPENIIHKYQRELTGLALDEVYVLDKSNSQYDLIRKKMDIALASDQFWWASAKPWWSLEMIEEGAYLLLNLLRGVPSLEKEKLERGRDLYERIVSTAFNWQRTGKIRHMMAEQVAILRIPFMDRTIGRGGSEEGVYWAFIDMMKRLEREATEKREYEKAILWRDAMYKLENKLDIYDTINAIDLLRIEIPNEEVEETIKKYKEKYYEIRGGQPEQRGA
jgi:hypothetical protein